MRLLAAAVFAVLLGLSSVATAAPFTLTDGNASVVIDPDKQTGISNWTTDGVNQLNQQWFWYRVGASRQENSLDTVSHTTSQAAPNLSPRAPLRQTITRSGRVLQRLTN
jgi:hypothetical protein